MIWAPRQTSGVSPGAIRWCDLVGSSAMLADSSSFVSCTAERNSLIPLPSAPPKVELACAEYQKHDEKGSRPVLWDPTLACQHLERGDLARRPSGIGERCC